MGKILLIEDNGVLADEIKKELNNDHEVIVYLSRDKIVILYL